MVVKRAGLLLLAVTSTLFLTRLTMAHKAISEDEELGIAPQTITEGTDAAQDSLDQVLE